MIPRIRNKTSQALDEYLSFALRTINIVSSATTNKYIKAIKLGTSYSFKLAMLMTFAIDKLDKTIITTHSITTIQVKKLAMLYITLEALSIYVTS